MYSIYMTNRNGLGQFEKGFWKEMPSEIRNKISNSLKGHSISQETKDKISKTLTGRELSPVHIEKMKKILALRDQTGEKNPFYKHGLTKTKEYKRMMKHNYKMKRKQVEVRHTSEEWEQLKKTYHYMCLCCKRTEPEVTLSEDHIIPLSKGGTDDIWNIQPLCTDCNSIKHTKTIDYRQSVGWFG